MSKSKLEAVVQFLERAYDAEVIIITGSRALGDHKPTSDWDIYIFTHIKPSDRSPLEFKSSLPSIIKDEDLDVYVNNFDKATYPDKLYRDLRNSVVVLDKDDYGKKLRKEALRLYDQGPKMWTKSYAQWRQNKAQRYMKKFKELLKEGNDQELFLRISSYFDENLIEWWFGVRREFRLRPQQAFPYIKKNDPSFYRQVEMITSDKSGYAEKVRAIEQCNKIFFESKEYQRLIK